MTLSFTNILKILLVFLGGRDNIGLLGKSILPHFLQTFDKPGFCP